MIVIIPDSVVTTNINRLVNQMWKLIPMRENQENWHSQLDTVFIEVAGLAELSTGVVSDKYLILLTKLKGLEVADVSFQTYRKTVFECISLLRELRL